MCKCIEIYSIQKVNVCFSVSQLALIGYLDLTLQRCHPKTMCYQNDTRMMTGDQLVYPQQIVKRNRRVVWGMDYLKAKNGYLTWGNQIQIPCEIHSFSVVSHLMLNATVHVAWLIDLFSTASFCFSRTTSEELQFKNTILLQGKRSTKQRHSLVYI